MITRRTFMKAGALALASFASHGPPRFLARALAGTGTVAGAASQRPVLVAIFQRGAMDGIMAVPPFRDRGLRTLRPRLAMDVHDAAGQIIGVDTFRSDRPLSDEPIGLVDLDGRFAMHGALAPLARLFAHGELVVVHGVGSPEPTRSHFDAQDYMETATPGRKGTESGWLNRVASELDPAQATPFQAVAMTSSLPRSLYGRHPALAISDLADFGMHVPRGARGGVLVGESFESLYEETSQELLHGAGRESFEALDIMQSIDADGYVPEHDARYPGSKLGKNLRQVAQLIKSGVGLEVAFAEAGGWDTHVQQGRRTGAFARPAADLAASIAALWTDLGDERRRVVVLTMTEFGRTVHENGSGGTDHGRGSCLFVLGKSIQGGRVLGHVPDLERQNLEDGRDLPVSTDFRAVFADVARAHLGTESSPSLFPGWTGSPIHLFGS